MKQKQVNEQFTSPAKVRKKNRYYLRNYALFNTVKTPFKKVTSTLFCHGLTPDVCDGQLIETRQGYRR